MAKVLSFEEFRARSLPRGRAVISKAASVERKAADLMAAAAALLLESSPGNIKIAWMLQDLGDLLISNTSENNTPANDGDDAHFYERDVLTNLG